MRYRAEFKLPLDVVGLDKNIESNIEYSKKAGAAELGILIASKVGWEEKPDDGKRFALEVQCFSMKDWEMFKLEIRNLIPDGYSMSLHRLFKSYESASSQICENKIDK